jgi:hypothetical protein
MRTRPLLSFLLLTIALLGSAFADRVAERPGQVPARHDTAFHTIPDGKLQVRAVQYDGSTNGTLTVQIRNTGKVTQKFSAQGLYFVPEGDPNTAPQRLGAVGPMQIAGSGKEISELDVAPGATLEVALDVFCIDSHRSSPSPANRFNVGVKRLPRELATTIENRAKQAVDSARAGGASAPRPAAKGQIQSEVWRSRDAKWVELDGEGTQEAGKKR